MKLRLSVELLAQIHAHAEEAYPDEGAGLMLGSTNEDSRLVFSILPASNTRQGDARKTRYLIAPKDLLHAEREASRQGLEVVGVFHSHPDHPNLPSEFDREWALPWFSYLITTVRTGKATQSRSWRLTEDRLKFLEEEIEEQAQTND